MRRLRVLIALLATAFACAVGASACGATSALTPVNDCEQHNGTLTGHYTVAELRSALATMPISVKEYTSCFSVISDQIDDQVGHGTLKGSGSGGGGGGFPVLIVIVIVVVLGGGGGAAFVAYRRRDVE